MNCRHFGIEDKSSTGFFELSIYGRHECLEKNRGGGVDASAYAYLSL